MNPPTQSQEKLSAFLFFSSVYSLTPIVIGCFLVVFLPYYPLLLSAEFHKVDSVKFIDWFCFVFSWAFFQASWPALLYGLLMGTARVRQFGLPVRLGLSMLAGFLAGTAIGRGLVIADLFGVLGLLTGLLLEVNISVCVYCLNQFASRRLTSKAPEELKISEN